VIALGSGRLVREQVLSVAALHVGAKGCLAAGTALEVHGFTGLGTSDTSVVHVVHPRASSVPPLDGLRVHESRRLRPEDIERRRSLPVTSAARSAIDRASWQPHPRFAFAMVAAAVQQRLTRPDLLAIELRRAGRIRHAHHLRLALADVTGGRSGARRAGSHSTVPTAPSPAAGATAIRTDRHGRRRYLDAEWELPQGRTVVLEVDGSHHMAAEHWTADMRRDRRLVLDSPGSVVLRCASSEVRLAGGDLVDDLVTAGVPRRRRQPVTATPPPMAT
jgi:hypothetical protein